MLMAKIEMSNYAILTNARITNDFLPPKVELQRLCSDVFEFNKNNYT